MYRERKLRCGSVRRSRRRRRRMIPRLEKTQEQMKTSFGRSQVVQSEGVIIAERIGRRTRSSCTISDRLVEIECIGTSIGMCMSSFPTPRGKKLRSRLANVFCLVVNKVMRQNLTISSKPPSQFDILARRTNRKTKRSGYYKKKKRIKYYGKP